MALICSAVWTPATCFTTWPSFLKRRVGIDTVSYTHLELLLSDYLEHQSDDPRQKRFALAHRLTDTYFHNFITHLLEAAFQRKVYTLIEEGETFGAVSYTHLAVLSSVDFSFIFFEQYNSPNVSYYVHSSLLVVIFQWFCNNQGVR